MVYDTVVGRLCLTRDSKSVILRAARHGWIADLASRDKRCSAISDQLAKGDHVLAYGWHKAIYNSGKAWAWRAASVGCLPDARSLNRSLILDRKASPLCMCGKQLADRRHWMFECSPVPQRTRLKNDTEKSLALRLVKMHMRRAHHNDYIMPGLSEAIQALSSTRVIGCYQR